MTTTFRTFGTIDLTATGRGTVSTVLAQPKRVALLLYLAVARPHGFHRRDRIVSLFWPELDERQARQALNRAVHQLRRGLGDEAIVSRGDDELALGASVECDARHLEEALARGDLAAAVELYAGALADGLYIEDAPEFERWLEGERRRLRDLVAGALDQLSEQSLRDGDARAALHFASRAVALSPQDEPLVRRLMAARMRAGDRAGALRAYEELRTALASELEVEPGAETRSLATQIKKRELPAVVEDREAAAPRLPSPGAPSGPVAEGRRRSPGRSFILVAAAVVISIVALTARGTAGRGAAAPPALHPNRVLVGVLKNETGDSTLDAVGTMAMDFMTQGISAAALVEVVDPAGAVLATRGIDTLEAAHRDPGTLARALAIESGAGLVISGAYSRVGDSLLFRAQLNDLTRGVVARTFQPVSAPVSAPAEALTDLRRQAVDIVAEATEPLIARFSQGAPKPASYPAYLEYVKGIELYANREERRAAEHFVRAAEIDSSFTLAMLMATNSLGLEDARTGGWLERLSRLRESLPPMQRLWLDQRLAAERGDAAEALRLLGELARLSPGSMWPFYNAVTTYQRGYERRALALILEIDPQRGWMKGWYTYWSMRTMIRHSLGQHDLELEEAERGRAMFPGNVAPLTAKARALAVLGRRAELETTLDEALTTPPSGGWNAGSVIGVAALEARAHGHGDWLPWLRDRALAWYASLPPADQTYEAPAFGHSWMLYAVDATPQLATRLDRLEREQGPTVDILGYRGVLAARAGDRAAALVADSALRRFEAAADPRQVHYHFLANAATYRRAQIAAALGENARALTLLRTILGAPGVSRFYVHTEPALASLRATPEYVAIVAARE